MHEITGKRAVENKDLGPLVKTSMNRSVPWCVLQSAESAGADLVVLVDRLGAGASSARDACDSPTRSPEWRTSERPDAGMTFRSACMLRR